MNDLYWAWYAFHKAGADIVEKVEETKEYSMGAADRYADKGQ